MSQGFPKKNQNRKEDNHTYGLVNDPIETGPHGLRGEQPDLGRADDARDVAYKGDDPGHRQDQEDPEI